MLPGGRVELDHNWQQGSIVTVTYSGGGILENKIPDIDIIYLNGLTRSARFDIKLITRREGGILIALRNIQEQDTEAVKSIMRQYELQFPEFVIHYYPERWANYFNGSSRSEYWVAVCGEEVVGHAGFLFNNELNLYEIVGVVVSPKYKRQGIGRKLLDKVCERIRQRGGKKVVLFTLGHPGNEDTLRFYKSTGYVEEKYELDYFRPGYSRVTFTKELV